MCSTIILGSGEQKFLAENYDFFLAHGLIGINLKGSIKENGRRPGEKKIVWKVQYGSVTFNQFSLELPVSGMNEKGLAVSLMWHDEGDMGAPSDKRLLSELQWIQFQLDNYQNIEEVLIGLGNVRPKQTAIPLHYIFLDAHGDSMIVEFIEGKQEIQKNPAIPILTNSTYLASLARADSEEDFQEQSTNSSHGRFQKLYELFQAHPKEVVKLETGFKFLEAVSQRIENEEEFVWTEGSQSPTLTVWSIIFDTFSREIFFRTCQNKSIRLIKLDDFNFENNQNYLTMDINHGAMGNISNAFEPYSAEQNRTIVQKSAQIFHTPAGELESLINSVDTLYKNRIIQLG